MDVIGQREMTTFALGHRDLLQGSVRALGDCGLSFLIPSCCITEAAAWPSGPHASLVLSIPFGSQPLGVVFLFSGLKLSKSASANGRGSSCLSPLTGGPSVLWPRNGWAGIRPGDELFPRERRASPMGELYHRNLCFLVAALQGGPCAPQEPRRYGWLN